MSKKVITFSLIFLFVVFFILLILFFFFRKDKTSERGDLSGPGLFNPFGETFPTQTFERDTDFDSQFQFTDDSRLKQITTVPVSGFDIFYQEINSVANDASAVSGETADGGDGGEGSGGALEKSDLIRGGSVVSVLADLKTDSFETIFRYTERSTGHVYETSFDSDVNTRISNTTISRNQRSIFLNNGEKIIYQLVPENDPDVVRTYLSDFAYNSSSQKESETFSAANSKGSFLMNDITHLIRSSAGQLFALLSSKTPSRFSSVGFLIDTEDPNNIDIVLESEISEWRPQWVGEKTVALTTAPSYNNAGYSFKLDVASGSKKRVLGPLLGLITNYSPNGKYVFLSTSDEAKTNSYIYNLDTLELTRTFLDSLADKCVWSIDSANVYCGGESWIPPTSPDLWYKGLHHFNDILISYNMESLDFRIYYEYNPNLVPPLDVINLKVSDNEDFFIFQNKGDLTLWAYDLRQ